MLPSSNKVCKHFTELFLHTIETGVAPDSSTASKSHSSSAKTSKHFEAPLKHAK